ncbi:MAG: hypothetical protein IJD96_13285 [Lachnospiraceae bacterium]|nr:hypothetical protein [Lachnospiraceae bacterium]
MGLFNFKKKLTPEELEEKQRKEQEWAKKCCEAGERFGEKIRIDDRIRNLNRFANNYPKTFFTLLFGIIIGCLALNIIFSGIGSIFSDTAEDIKTVAMPKDTSKDALNQEMKALYEEFMSLDKQLERKFSKDSLTRQDSIEIMEICGKMERLEQIMIERNPVRQEEEEISLYEEMEILGTKVEELKRKQELTRKDSLELNSYISRMKLIMELIDTKEMERKEENK